MTNWVCILRAYDKSGTLLAERELTTDKWNPRRRLPWLQSQLNKLLKNQPAATKATIDQRPESRPDHTDVTEFVVRDGQSLARLPDQPTLF